MTFTSSDYAFLPRGHRLLAGRQFDALDAWLESEMAEPTGSEFMRDRALTVLAFSGNVFLQEINDWYLDNPERPYARLVLGMALSGYASDFRGTDIISNTKAEDLDASWLCADIAARYLVPELYENGPGGDICGYLVNLFGFAREPEWLTAPDQPDTLKDKVSLHLPGLAEIAVPPVPDLDVIIWFNNRSLLDFASGRDDEFFFPLNAWQNYLLPQWGGSVRQMNAFADGPETAGLSDDRRAVLKIAAAVAELPCPIPPDTPEEEQESILAEVDAAEALVTGPRSRAEWLVERGEILYRMRRSKDGTAAFHEAFSLAKLQHHRMFDNAPNMLRWYPDSPITGELAEAAFLTGNVYGAATLAACYKTGLGGMPKNPAWARAICAYVARYQHDRDKWEDAAREICYHDDRETGIWLLDIGLEENLPDVHETYTRMLLSGNRLDQDIPRARQMAAAGVEAGHKDAMLPVYLHDIEEDNLEDEEEIATLRKLGEIGLRQNNTHVTEIVLKEMDGHIEYDAEQDDPFTFSLARHAFEAGEEWAAGHMAFHLQFGFGVEKNTQAARDLANYMLESRPKDPRARRVLRAQRYPFLYWFRRAPKVSIRDLLRDLLFNW